MPKPDACALARALPRAVLILIAAQSELFSSRGLGDDRAALPNHGCTRSNSPFS